MFGDNRSCAFFVYAFGCTLFICGGIVLKKVLSVVLCLIMMIGTVAIGESGFFEALNVISIKGSAKAKYLTDYNIGDIILFGSYPQTDVTESLGSILTPIATNWKSYNYYSGSGVKNDGQMNSSDYMQYCDITYCNCKYRGVTFSEYRPYFTGYTTSSSKSY